MAQKTNPVSLRLGKTNRDFDCCWYNNSNYVYLLMRDFKIKNYINFILKKIKFSSARFLILNLHSKIKVNVFFCNPSKSRQQMSQIFRIVNYTKKKKSKKNLFTNNHKKISEKQNRICNYLNKHVQNMYTDITLNHEQGPVPNILSFSNNQLTQQSSTINMTRQNHLTGSLQPVFKKDTYLPKKNKHAVLENLMLANAIKNGSQATWSTGGLLSAGNVRNDFYKKSDVIENGNVDKKRDAELITNEVGCCATSLIKTRNLAVDKNPNEVGVSSSGFLSSKVLKRHLPVYLEIGLQVSSKKSPAKRVAALPIYNNFLKYSYVVEQFNQFLIRYFMIRYFSAKAFFLSIANKNVSITTKKNPNQVGLLKKK